MTSRLLIGDVRDRLHDLPDSSVQCVVTSPPYFGLRDYGADGQIGLEATPDEFIAALVDVFREVRRVLRDDGTVWLNIGDSYAATGGHTGQGESSQRQGRANVSEQNRGSTRLPPGYKSKDLLMIPAQLALALRSDGWYLRSEIIWAKPNPMPESVTDRPTSAHEKLFLLAKRPRYFYDADAVREDAIHEGRVVKASGDDAKNGAGATDINDRRTAAGFTSHDTVVSGRNKRNVWGIATQPYSEAHFATFPPKLVEPCVLAGTSPKACGQCGAPWERAVDRERSHANGDLPVRNWRDDGVARLAAAGRRNDVTTTVTTTGWSPMCSHDDDTGRSIVLDPFAGSGTVGVVCAWHGRDFIGIELNPAYAAMAKRRIMIEGHPTRRERPADPIVGQLALEL